MYKKVQSENDFMPACDSKTLRSFLLILPVHYSRYKRCRRFQEKC